MAAIYCGAVPAHEPSPNEGPSGDNGLESWSHLEGLVELGGKCTVPNSPMKGDSPTNDC